MKKSELRQIIREEISKVMNESIDARTENYLVYKTYASGNNEYVNATVTKTRKSTIAKDIGYSNILYFGKDESSAKNALQTALNKGYKRAGKEPYRVFPLLKSNENTLN
jgi:hypothetical protein